MLLFIFSVINLSAQRFNQDLNNIQVTWQLINNFYVDTINTGDLAQKTIKAMLEQLDPHSSYLTPEQVKIANDRLGEKEESIGIEFQVINDTLFITGVNENSSASIEDVRIGDRILSINNHQVSGLGLSAEEIVEKYRVEKGDIMNLIIERQGTPDNISKRLEGQSMKTSSIHSYYMIDKRIGYIKIENFSLYTGNDFKDVLKTLKKSGMKSLILDLRDNTGGYVSAAISVLDQFLSKGQTMIYTEGATSPRHNFTASSKGGWQKGSLVVLINEKTASASEVVAGSIQDWDRGVIVGRRSYGKGLVQRPFSLTDGSQVRLTVSRYYTPSGRLIQKDYSNGVTEYRQELSDRSSNGELLNGNNIQFDEELKYRTLLNKRVVYGGGGIMPDLYIPIEAPELPPHYREIIDNKLLQKMTLNYISQNFEELQSSLNSFDDLMDETEHTIQFVNNILDVVENGRDNSEKNKFRDLLNSYFKATLAKGFYSQSDYHKFINQSQDVFVKAVEIIKDEKIADLLY